MTSRMEQLRRKAQWKVKCSITGHPSSQLLNRDIAVTMTARHAIDSHNRICHEKERKEDYSKALEVIIVLVFGQKCFEALAALTQTTR